MYLNQWRDAVFSILKKTDIENREIAKKFSFIQTGHQTKITVEFTVILGLITQGLLLTNYYILCKLKMVFLKNKKYFESKSADKF